MKDLRDPEFDQPDEDEHPGTPGECRRGRCDGSGWIQVSEAYVDKVSPWPTASLPDNPTEEEQTVHDALMNEARLLRNAHANSSFPCPTCMPVAFARWRKGHWSNRHERATCPECMLIDGTTSTVRRRAKRKARQSTNEEGISDAPTPPDRADLG